jgi:cytosine/adenosine deaminase-related metal-dependent hydrolase
MPFLSASQIHNGINWLPDHTTIEMTDDGTIVAIHDQPNKETTHYDGILTPGFINVHCHLELSHLKGTIPEHTGLIAFLETVPQTRNKFTEEQKTDARHKAYRELQDNGTVALGDIANTTDALDLRAGNQLHIHTFIESIGFTAANAERSFGFAVGTYNAYAGQQQKEALLRQSITPHAPYSVSSALFRLIDAHTSRAIISIHNQESEEENKFYKTKEGDVRRLLKTLGIDDSGFIPSGKTSLQSYLEWFTHEHPFILVHNTRSSAEDIKYATERIKDLYWCLCPNANLYIENALPDINMLMNAGAGICIGTDSLASNHRLSILSELQTIKSHYAHISWETLLHWATYNGACALQMQDVVGSIAPGMKPGILQITNLEHANAGINRIV